MTHKLLIISGRLKEGGGQQRLVGYALHNLPRNSGVPWQRVINSQGKISFPKNTNGYTRQKKLLRKEGIIFEKEKIDLEKFGIMAFLEKEKW